MTTKNLKINFKPRKWQQECMDNFNRFSVLALHRRAGKTTLGVAMLLTAALTTTGNYAYVSPQKNQSKANMWDIIKFQLSEFLEFQAARNSKELVDIRDSDLTVHFANKSKIFLLGAEDPDKIRGAKLNGAIIDEVAQMPREIWFEILRPALMDTKGFALFIGTPKGINLFSDLFDRGNNPSFKDEWVSMRYTCYDTGVLSPTEIENYRKEVDENTFRREMLCDFSASGEDQVISYEAVSEAMMKIPDQLLLTSPDPLIMGVDVSRYGNDRSVIFFRKGFVAEKPIFTSHCSIPDLASFVNYHYSIRLPEAVFVDGTGVGGGVVDLLTDFGLPVYDINFSKKSFDPRYKNKRTEMWFKMAEWIRQGGCIYPDDHLKSELAAPIYKTDEGGQICLESKKDIRCRLGKSPDMADALALTFAQSVSIAAETMRSNIRIGRLGRRRVPRFYRAPEMTPIQRFEDRVQQRRRRAAWG